jgi:hypothetical protein
VTKSTEDILLRQGYGGQAGGRVGRNNEIMYRGRSQCKKRLSKTEKGPNNLD